MTEKLQTLLLTLTSLICLLGLTAFFLNSKLISYLKTKHHKKYRGLTSINNFGPGLSTGPKWISYILNSENDDEYEKKLKHSIKLTIFLFLSLILTLIIIISVLGVFEGLFCFS